MNFFLQISVYSYPSAKYMTVNICNYSEKALDIKEKEKEIVERFNCKSCKYQKYCTGKDITLKHKTEAIKKYGKYFKTIK